jgi:copper chaperone NosL
MMRRSPSLAIVAGTRCRGARRLTPVALALVLLAHLGCSGGVPPPATLDTANDQCAFCRMAVSDQKFAGQLVAPGEEPKFFDDLGCLVNYVGQATPPSSAVAYVADHRTGEWVRAAAAVYSRVDTLETPMGSHLVAHADDASRQADAHAAQGDRRTAADVFGPAGPPDGGR